MCCLYISFKCYKLFDNSSNYFEASTACRNSGEGSIDARLALIDSYAELDLIRGLCRGPSGSSPQDLGCWVGMVDNVGNGSFQWEETGQRLKNIHIDRFDFSFTFSDWRRGSRSNITVTDGAYIESNKRCVHIVPWTIDPLITEQGSLLDVSCAVPKAYVCQMKAKTTKYILTATASSFQDRSAVVGGTLSLTGSVAMSSLGASRTAAVGRRQCL